MNLSKANFTVCEKKHSEVFQIKNNQKKYVYKILEWNGLIKSVCAYAYVCVCVMATEPL